MKSGCLRNTHGARGIRVFYQPLDATGGGWWIAKMLTFRESERRPGNTRFLFASENVGCDFGANWGFENSGCIEITHRVRRIRVFHPSLYFVMFEIWAFDIWVPQKYAPRSKNTRFSHLPKCNWRRPGGGQHLDIPGIRAALEEYAFFQCV